MRDTKVDANVIQQQNGLEPSVSSTQKQSARVGSGFHIGSSDGDYAPSPSHTTGRAVFRIRRLNPAALRRGNG